MAINKVVVDGATVLDLTRTTVTQADLPKDKTALDKTGALLTGTTPKIHSAEGTFNLSNTTENGTVNYTVRDDVVNIYGSGIKVGSGSNNPGGTAVDIKPGHDVYGHANLVDSDGFTYTNKAYVCMSQYGSFLIYGASEGDVVDFNLTYIMEG